MTSNYITSLERPMEERMHFLAYLSMTKETTIMKTSQYHLMSYLFDYHSQTMMKNRTRNAYNDG